MTERPHPRSRTARGVVRCFCVLVLVGIAWLPSVAAHAQSSHLAYVDMKRLLDNAPQVVSGRAALAREFAARDAELKGYESKLAGLHERENRDGSSLPRDAAEALRQEISTLDRNVAHLRERLRDDLKQRSAEEINKRWPEIHDAVVEYAREQGIDLVVESPVIYASANIDITDAVLARLKRRAAGFEPKP